MCVIAKVEEQEVWGGLGFLSVSLFVNILVLRMKHKGCKERSVVVGKKVMVAVRASKETSKAALLWTLTHVVQPGDRIRLLVVVPSNYTSTHLFLFLFPSLSLNHNLVALAASWS